MYTFVGIHACEDPILPWVTNNISGYICNLHTVNSISSHHVFEPCGGNVANKLFLVTSSVTESCASMEGSRPKLKYRISPSPAQSPIFIQAAILGKENLSQFIF